MKITKSIRILLIFLAAVIVLSFVSCDAYFTEFEKILGLINHKNSDTTPETEMKTEHKDDDWFEKNVKCAFETALMLGTSDTEFSPNDNVTIAQAITLAARIHSIYRTGKADFEQEEVWYSVYVDYLERNNMKSFSQYTDFNKEATREEVVNILYTSLSRGVFKAINSIAQIPDYQWSASAVLDFYNAGILTGSDENRSFKPDTYITRAEISAIVTRMIDAELRVKFK